MGNVIQGFISLILAGICSIFIVMGAGGTAAGQIGIDFPESWIRYSATGLIIFVLLAIFFFYRRFRGHPERPLLS